MELPRKISFLVLLSLFMLSNGLVFADQPFTTIQLMRSAVRSATQISEEANLPEATLTKFCHQALIWTSTDIGGIEVQYRIALSNNQRFKVLPDTICRIISASIVTNEYTQEMKQVPPQYTEDVNIPTRLESNENDNVPQAFSYWADTMQLLPIPNKSGDTIILQCYVEHPADSTIKLRGAYCDAALYDAVARVYESLEKYASAAYWHGEYAKKKEALAQIYQRRFEQRPPKQQAP